MPISHYPRFGERIAPQTLDGILDIRVCDSVRIGQLPSRIRFNQLDESIWERTSSHHCEELAQALVEIVRLSLPDLLECRTEQTLPPLPHGVELDDLSLSVRTYNCLNNSYEGDLRVLRKAIFENVLSLPGFGARSLVDLLVAIETCVATAAPEAAPFAGDERQAARLYVAQLIHRHPTLRRKLQSSLDYQLAQYDGFIHKGIWASQARAAFDAKVSYGLEVSATLPLWPSSQIALDFEATAKEEPKSQTTQQELLANETQTENLIVSGDNRVLDHVAQVADVLNAVDEQSDVFRASSHRLAALMHSGFEPNVANEELKQMRSSIQSLTEIVATWEKFASSLQDGQHLSHQPDEEVRAATKRIADISGATSIRCDDPRFGDYVNRLDSQSQTLEEAFAQAINQSCQPHLRIQLQECLRALEVYLKVCSAMTVEEELHSLVKSALELSSTRLNTQRQEEMCARRYGWDGQGGATLQEMALDVGVSRERIRQICKPVEQAIDVLAPLEPCVPSLKRALQFAAERAPVSLQEIEDELHDAQITKGRLRVRQLLRIAGWLGCPSPIAISQIGGQADGQPMVVLVDDDNGVPEQRKVNNVLQKARKAVSRWGTAHIEEIAANVIEDFGGENSESDIRRIIHVLESQPDFAWLDEENGWFWFSSTPRNGLVTQINKALAVASRLRVADLRAAVSRHHRRQGFAPPQRVLLELCRQCGFSVHEGIIDAKSSSDSSDALSETEWYMVQVLNEHGPLMSRADFEQHCRDLGIPRGTFYTYLNHSAALHKYARSVYGLPGVDVEPGEVEALAPDSRQGRRQVLRDFGRLESGEVWMGYRMSNHMLSHGNCNVPVAMQPFIHGRFAVRSADNTPFGSLMCKDNYGNGLGSFFRRRGAEEGDFLVIVFDLKKQEAILHLGDEGLLEDYQMPDETKAEENELEDSLKEADFD